MAWQRDAAEKCKWEIYLPCDWVIGSQALVQYNHSLKLKKHFREWEKLADVGDMTMWYAYNMLCWTLAKEFMISPWFVCLFVFLHFSRIEQNLPNWFSWTLVKRCSMGLERAWARWMHIFSSTFKYWCKMAHLALLELWAHHTS